MKRSGVAIGSVFVLSLLASVAYAVVQVLPEAAFSVDGRAQAGGTAAAADPLVSELVGVFERTEHAVQKQDLEGLLRLYSPGFNYHGLKADGVRRIWGEVFEYYRNVSSTHLFSDIKILHESGQVRAEVACTGGLYGTDRRTGKAVTLDSWFREVHYLVKEEGQWRLLGNRGDAPTSAPFASVPHHPLF